MNLLINNFGVIVTVEFFKNLFCHYPAPILKCFHHKLISTGLLLSAGTHKHFTNSILDHVHNVVTVIGHIISGSNSIVKVSFYTCHCCFKALLTKSLKAPDSQE